MPYHHSEAECHHCIGDMRAQKRRLEENDRLSANVDKKPRLEEERCGEMLCEGTPEDKDVDAFMSDIMTGLSTQSQSNELMKIGGKRRMDTGEENESPTKKLRYAERKLHSSTKRKRDIECNDVNVSKKNKATGKVWEEVRWWSKDKAEWRIQ
jgi:hypothetical protein